MIDQEKNKPVTSYDQIKEDWQDWLSSGEGIFVIAFILCFLFPWVFIPLFLVAGLGFLFGKKDKEMKKSFRQKLGYDD